MWNNSGLILVRCSIRTDWRYLPTLVPFEASSVLIIIGLTSIKDLNYYIPN